MEENRKVINEYSDFLNRSISKIRNVKDSEESVKLPSFKSYNNNEFPLIQNAITPSNHNNMNNSEYSRNFISNSLQKLLFNSISFDTYQKAILDIKSLNNSKDILPPIIHEEKKDGGKKIDNFFNDFNISSKSTKKYSFCLKTLYEINNNKRYEFSKLKECKHKNIYDISKNKILREIILNEYSNNDEILNYEEQKILGNFKYYNKWMNKKLLELKKEVPLEENVHRILEKEYKNSKYNNPLLVLNSLTLSFKCKGKNHFFHIPFEYMPLFYYKNMNYLKYILASIIKFDNNFEDINIDFDEIIYILSCSKQFEIKEEKEREKEVEEEKEEEIANNGLFLLNKIKSEKIVLNSTIKLPKAGKNLSSKRLNNKFKDLIEGTKEGIKKKNTFRSTGKRSIKNKHDDQEVVRIKKIKNVKKIIPTEEKNLYKCIYNKFMFIWITPKYNYNVEVKTPEAIFRIGKTVLKAYIDIELIFYLLETNFKNWDYYVSQYLFSYKECQKKILSSLSVGEKQNAFPLLKNSKSCINIKEKCEAVKRNKINYLNTEKICRVSEKSKKFDFICSDENNINYIKILHNFLITSRCKAFNKKKFCFDFNFFHMKILAKISRIQGLNFFLKKLILIDRQTLNLKFGYDELCTLANDQYKVLEKHDPNKTGATNCIRMKERSKDVINFSISFPALETIKYNNLNYENCFESDYDDVIFDGIPLDILDELCVNDFSEWPNILMKIKS